MALRTRVGYELPSLSSIRDVHIDGPVLLIEDEESARSAAVASLEALGVSEVITACDGGSGLKLVEERCPVIVLVDLLMPVIDGFAVLQGIRARPRRLRPGRVIVLSGIDDPVVEKNIIQLGADRVLRKPYHLVDLFEALVG